MRPICAFYQPAYYKIRISGVLSQDQLGDCHKLTAIVQPGSETLLVGAVADQRELHDILARILSRGLGLLSLHRIETVAGVLAVFSACNSMGQSLAYG